MLDYVTSVTILGQHGQLSAKICLSPLLMAGNKHVTISEHHHDRGMIQLWEKSTVFTKNY